MYADCVHLRLKVCCQQSKWAADVGPACCHQGGCEEQLSMDPDFHGGTLQPGHRQWGHHLFIAQPDGLSDYLDVYVDTQMTEKYSKVMF